ncbi:hypothetical protein VTN02DRAFT_5539 [Thermoascus thermophilus]
MSLTSHPGQSVELARLVLAKFSHTTTSVEYNAPLSWHHILGQGDLVAVFEKRRVTAPETNHVHEQALLKVIRNREVLEDLDLNSLAREATSQALSRQIGNTKPSVAVIVKPPCLAVRYPSSIGQIRRFQIKFSSDRDYYNALAILSALRCPLTESSGGPLPSSLRPLSSSSQLCQGSAASVASAPVSGFSGTGLSSHNGIFPTPSPSEERPYEARSSVIGSSLSSTSSHTAYNTINPTSGTRIPKEQESNHAVPRFSQESALHGPGVSKALDSSLSRDRPSTAPVYHDTQLLNQILPPKRELPFSKPAGKKTAQSAKSRATKKLSDNKKRPESSPYFPAAATGMDPSPTHPGLTGGVAATSESRDGGHSAGSGEIKTTIPPPDRSLQPGSEVERSLQADPLPQHQADLSVPFIRPNNIFSHGGAITESQSHLSPPSTVAQTSQMLLNPQPEQETWKVSSTNAGSSWDNNTAIPPTAAAATKIITSTDLSSYLSTPSPERTALVELWVCQQLEDDGFLKLCEDVEGVWKRIAFGR